MFINYSKENVNNNFIRRIKTIKKYQIFYYLYNTKLP